MKLLLTALLLSVQAFAAESQNLQKIEDPQMLEQYKNAVYSAMAGKKLVNCRDMTGKAYEPTGSSIDLSGYPQAVLNRSAQPVLTFSVSEGGGLWSISFSTSPDFKTLISFVSRSYKTRSVNAGTIVDPNFVNQQYMSKQNTCDIQ